MTDILGIILTTQPRCIGCGEPATIIDAPFTLCDLCEARLTESLRQSGFPVTPETSSGVKAAAIEIAPPDPTVVAAPLSEVPVVRDRQAAGAASQPVSPAVASAVDPGPCGFDWPDVVADRRFSLNENSNSVTE